MQDRPFLSNFDKTGSPSFKCNNEDFFVVKIETSTWENFFPNGLHAHTDNLIASHKAHGFLHPTPTAEKKENAVKNYSYHTTQV